MNLRFGLDMLANEEFSGCPKVRDADTSLALLLRHDILAISRSNVGHFGSGQSWGVLRERVGSR